jgi:hypothetical protein
LGTKKEKVVIEATVDVVQSAIRGGNKGFELGLDEKALNETDSSAALVTENEKESQDETAQEGQADRRAEESDEGRVHMGGHGFMEPGPQSGARNAVIFGILSLGGRRVVGMGKSGGGGGNLALVPAKRVLANVDGLGRVIESHGSGPLVVCAKDTIGIRAMLFQGRNKPPRTLLNKKSDYLPRLSKLAGSTITVQSEHSL